ncbi:hypothetical protein [Flavobacterium ardleyense]|uniref:hypothetical protein n=1 Tax=Flavobacterium ardleyense TaxID=2038737 RepID=UPI00298D4BEB|nr:hypothetical protein [Flavobacterium ardleyense]
MNNQNSNQSKGNRSANHRAGDNPRSDTQKHQYSDYNEEQTNDELFKGGKPKVDMDFRDKADNLADEEENKK